MIIVQPYYCNLTIFTTVTPRETASPCLTGSSPMYGLLGAPQQESRGLPEASTMNARNPEEPEAPTEAKVKKVATQEELRLPPVARLLVKPFFKLGRPTVKLVVTYIV